MPTASLIALLIALGACLILEALGERTPDRQARRRWPANLALLAISVGILGLFPFSTLIAASWARGQGFGLLNWLGLHGVAGIVLSYLALSFLDFLYHYASHRVPVLWRIHKIHHSDHVVDATTAFRQHPLATLLVAGLGAAACAILGLAPHGVAAFAVIALAADLIQHAALPFPGQLDLWLRRYVMVPSLHRIHHSDHAAETDRNYGRELVLWDRLFGTYLERPLRDAACFRSGLAPYPPERASDLDALLVAPFTRDPNG